MGFINQLAEKTSNEKEVWYDNKQKHKHLTDQMMCQKNSWLLNTRKKIFYCNNLRYLIYHLLFIIQISTSFDLLTYILLETFSLTTKLKK